MARRLRGVRGGAPPETSASSAAGGGANWRSRCGRVAGDRPRCLVCFVRCCPLTRRAAAAGLRALVTLSRGARSTCRSIAAIASSERHRLPCVFRSSRPSRPRRLAVATGLALAAMASSPRADGAELSHPEGRCGRSATRAKRPRNGVHAVRAGPPLARNLRLFVEGRPCRPYRPQRRSLALIACGDGSAIAEWHGWSLEGPAIGRWKDRIDREFVALNRAV